MIDLPKLAAQGRAYSGSRSWTPEELDALLVLERECELSRMEAAEYVRNGITTPAAYKKAKAADFKPKTAEEAEKEVEKALKKNEFADSEPELPNKEEGQKTRGSKSDGK